MNQNYTWSLAVFGSLLLHKYYLYAPTLCCSLLCWLALTHRGAPIDFQKAFMLASSVHWNHIFRNGASVFHGVEHPIFSDFLSDLFVIHLFGSFHWLSLLSSL